MLEETGSFSFILLIARNIRYLVLSSRSTRPWRTCRGKLRIRCIDYKNPHLQSVAEQMAPFASIHQYKIHIKPPPRFAPVATVVARGWHTGTSTWDLALCGARRRSRDGSTVQRKGETERERKRDKPRGLVVECSTERERESCVCE